MHSSVYIYLVVNKNHPQRMTPSFVRIQQSHFRSAATFQDFRYAATLVRGWSLKKVWFKRNTIFFGSKSRILKLFSFSVYWNMIFFEEPVSISVVLPVSSRGNGLGCSRQSCKSWKNQICKIQPDDWKRRWHTHPGLGYSSYFCWFRGWYQKEPLPNKKTWSVVFSCGASS